jgi:N-dimethylarginine dimethylaminohydrolase
MGATFLMSYPGPSWQIRGGANFRSRERPPANPRAAMKEWLRLCDAISAAGGRILVMPPGEPSLTGLVYTADAGALIKSGDRWTFLIAKMAVPHRQGERAPLRRFLDEAGMPCVEAEHLWEGQAELCTLPGNRYLLSWGVRSVKESFLEVQAWLPTGARVLDVQLREPFFHGDLALAPLQNRGGDTVLLAHGGALATRGIPELRSFLGPYGEVLPVDEEDALAGACSTLCVNGTLLVPAGLSVGLRGSLIHRGFVVEELELGELFGKGGGGPRALVNQLQGFVLTEEAPSYAFQRDRLYQLAERYPESTSGA